MSMLLLPRLSRSMASLLALVAFSTTIFLSYYLPQYIIILSGLLVVIFLSIFVNDRQSTVIAGAISGISVLIHLFFIVVLHVILL